MEDMTKDNNTGIAIRMTDNGLKEGDLESPQDKRVLTECEIKEILATVGDDNDVA